MNSREITQEQVTLGYLFRNDNDGVPLRFNNKARRGNYKYRIPIHQRYPHWKPDKIDKLINSVLSVYSIGGIIVSKHIESNENGQFSEYFDIEDGQSRLSILQRFYNDEISYRVTDVNRVKFSELDEDQKETFRSTIIPVQVLINFSDDELHEQFERLQEGEPLKDKDLYWNRSDTNFVQYALNLTRENYWRNEFMGTTKAIGDTYRDRLPDVCALVSAFIKDEPNRHITSSFRKHYAILNEPISEEIKNNIRHFLEYYFSIIRTVYNLPENDSKRMRPFYNVAKDLGMILIEYLDNPNMRTVEQLSSFKNKWVHIINYDINNEDFMKGRKLLWTGLTSAEKQNTHDPSLRARVNRVNQFYNETYILPE